MYIRVTKSNGDKTTINTEDIRYIHPKEGVYVKQKNDEYRYFNYHVLISCKNHDYYVLETYENIINLINQK